MDGILPAPDALVGKRLDVVVSKMMGISRSAASHLIESGQVTLLGHVGDKSAKLGRNDMLEFALENKKKSLNLLIMICRLSMKMTILWWSINPLEWLHMLP